MWRRGIGLAALASATPGVAHAEGGLRGHVPDGSCDVRAELGSTLESTSERELCGALSGESDFDVQEGLQGGVALGWAPQGSGLRLEALSDYSASENQARVFDTSLGADVDAVISFRLGALLAVAHNDFLHTERWQPSLGLGLGAVWLDIAVQSKSLVESQSIVNQLDADMTLGLRATAGMASVLSDRWVAELGCRHVFASGLESEFRDAQSGEIVKVEMDVQSHAITAGLRCTPGRGGG